MHSLFIFSLLNSLKNKQFCLFFYIILYLYNRCYKQKETIFQVSFIHYQLLHQSVLANLIGFLIYNHFFVIWCSCGVVTKLQHPQSLDFTSFYLSKLFIVVNTSQYIFISPYLALFQGFQEFPTSSSAPIILHIKILFCCSTRCTQG